MACVAWSLVATVATGTDVIEARRQLNREFRANLEMLSARCRVLGLTEQAQVTSSWFVTRDPNRQYLFLVPDTDPTEPSKEAPQLVRQWHHRFMLYRRQQAAALLELAQKTLDKGHATIAYQLLHEVLHEDLNQEQARRILGYRRVAGDWRKPSRSVRLGRVRDAHPQFGWKRDRYWRILSQHFRITTSHSPKAGTRLAEQLEEFYGLWQQIFFRYWSSKEALSARLAGENELLGREQKHEVIQFRDRDEYLDRLSQVEPQIAVSMGYYMHGRRTAFFYAGDESLRATWFHEAAHQLFQETRQTIDDVGAKWNFWIVEGVAVYVESLRPHDGYWTVGGFDADRLQYARTRTLKGGAYTPLEELVRLGRDDLQRHPDIRRIYTQSAGLAHFLMDGSGARFRRPLIAQFRTQYSGRDTTNSLALLTDTEFGTLDSLYKEFLEVGDEHLVHLGPPPFVRNLALGCTAITNEGLKYVARCDQLQWLDVSFTRVTDEGMNSLRDLKNLRQLSLESTRVTDTSLDVIAQFSELEELDLSGTSVTDAGIAKLIRLHKLKVLWLTNTAVTDEVFTTLKSLKNLKQLDITGTRVNKAAWSAFRKRLEGQVDG